MSLSYPKLITKLPGPKARGLIKRDKRFVSPSYTRDYPLVASKGRGGMIEDVDGNRFLDMTAGIAVTTTGHCHPQVVRAIKRQTEKLIHMSGTDFYYAPQINLAERLAGLMPGPGPKKVFFCNSGAEAIEGAIKLARYYTGRKQIIGFYGSFHGRTCGALSITASKRIQREKFFPLLPGIHHAHFPNPRETPDGKSSEEMATKCIDWIQNELFETILPPRQVAAIFVEPIQGEGGYIVPPPNFHRELQALCRKHGILYVVDEIQTGFGRTGKFFASEHFGVEPDIIAVAKGIASGLPLGAIISKADVMNWKPGAHASTFGGNPIACAAALATIDLVEKKLMSNAEKQGRYFKQQLLKLKQKHKAILDVRGIGLMLAIELKHPLRHAIIQNAFHKGLLLLGCGTDAIRFCPALSITKAEINTTITILDRLFGELK